MLDRLPAVLLDAGAAASLEVAGRMDAAVLVPLHLVGGDLMVVLTRRRGDLRHHAGQISFPGGRRDDGEDLRATAVREAHEEIGLEPQLVSLIGALQPTPTIATDFAVYPFVGVIRRPRAWTPAPREVDAVVELSIEEIRAGAGRRSLSRGEISFRTDTYKVGEHLIWGATARILADLFERIDALEG